MAEATILTEDFPSSDPDTKSKLVTVSGQLDESNVDEKSKEVYKLFEEVPGKLNLVFDFAGLEYMNSKSIGYLTDWYGKVTEKGGKVFIARAKPNIKDILEVVGLTQLIQVFESLDEAKQAVDAGASAEASSEASAEDKPETVPVTPQEVPATPAPAPTAPAEPAATPAPEVPAEVAPTPPETPATPAEPATPAKTAPAPEATPEAPAEPAPEETPETPETPAAEGQPEETYKLNDQK